jgi:hypothetical protein
MSSALKEVGLFKNCKIQDIDGVGNIADIQQDRSLSQLEQRSIIRNTKIKL